jgi:hypothetical protein
MLAGTLKELALFLEKPGRFGMQVSISRFFCACPLPLFSESSYRTGTGPRHRPVRQADLQLNWPARAESSRNRMACQKAAKSIKTQRTYQNDIQIRDNYRFYEPDLESRHLGANAG